MLTFFFLRVLKYHHEIISIGFVADVVPRLLLRRLNFFFVDVSVLLLTCFFFIAFIFVALPLFFLIRLHDHLFCHRNESFST